MGAQGRPLAPRHVVEYALIWAAGHGRREVVEFLLAKGPDLRVTDPVFGATALGFARHVGHADVVALLEPLY
jgi:ankyrin repeat protein